MKEKVLLASYFAALLLFISSLAAFQTSFWYQLLPNLVSPNLWLIVLIYFALYRSTLMTAVFSYLASLTLSHQTAMSEATLLISCLCVVLSTQMFKRRIYWPGASYILLITTVNLLIFELCQWTVDSLRSTHTFVAPNFMDWLIRCILTPPLAPLVFLACKGIERLTQQEQAIEFTAEVA